MEDIIIGSVGSAVGLVALVLFIRGLIFLLGGAETLGEVVSSRQDKKGRYVHKMRYTAGGAERVSEDKATYSAEIKPGTSLLLTYKRNAPDVFRQTKELRTATIGCGALALMGAAFAVRFLIL